MVFNSLSFVIFIIATFIIYWATPNRFRIGELCIFGTMFYLFCGWKSLLIVYLIGILSFFVAIIMARQRDKRTKKYILILYIAISITILLYFKYFNYLHSILSRLFTGGTKSDHFSIILPIGLSFYLFQTMGYVIDVYREKVDETKNIIQHMAFVLFFPQVIAGPISRAKELLFQISKEKKFEYNNATYAIKQMVWGYFKKLAIADVLVVFTDKVFNDVYSYTGASLLIASILYTIVIYCDFSGYSDIACGVARLFDIEIINNFRSPYFSKSIKEFWSRWHISLSTWFRDYVYIPLGGNRKGRVRTYINLVITFVLSGLWHGANNTFLVWGLSYGILQIVERILIKEKKDECRLISALRIILTFSICSTLWIFFRSNNIDNAIYMLRNMFRGITSPISYILAGIASIGIRGKELLIIVFELIILTLYDYHNKKTDVIKKISSWNKYVRWVVYVSICVLLVQIYCLKGVSNASFVYSNF